MIVHAAGESSPGNLPPGTYVVVLAAKNEPHLREIVERLVLIGIAHSTIYEPDFNNELMAVGIVPCCRSMIRKEVSQLPLLR